MADELTRLIHRLDAADPRERISAAEEISYLGVEAQAAAVALCRHAGADDTELIEWIVAALEELGPPRKSDLPQLIRRLTDDAPLVRYWATTLIGRSQHEATDAVDALTELLADKDIAVRQRAVWALGRIGPPAIASEAALQLAASDSDPRMSRLAKSALENIRS